MTSLEHFEKFMDYLRHTDYKDYNWETINKLSGIVRAALIMAELRHNNQTDPNAAKTEITQ